MPIDADALNYPYIRIRQVEWLKRTLLVFPHVVRIAPSWGSPEDNSEVAKFRDLIGRRGPLLRNVDLDSANIWNDQRELKALIEQAVAADRRQFLRRFGRQATEEDISLIQESADVWDDRLASRSFQLHRQKVVMELLDFLFENDLAWRPRYSHGYGYVEMHPRLGEAILATLAFACARNEGLRLVTEFPQIYGRTIHRSKEEIFSSCLGVADPTPEPQSDFQSSNLAEFIVHHCCDATKLTPEALLQLNKEWEAIGAFKEALEKLAADIPPDIENPKALNGYLKERAERMFERWTEDNKNLSTRLKQLLSGDAEEAAKVIEKLLEKGIGGESIGAAGGGLIGSVFGGSITYHGLLGAGAGLAVAIIIRTSKNIAGLRKKRKDDPLRYLTLMQKTGVSYVTSA